jgi:hypothetical protein
MLRKLTAAALIGAVALTASLPASAYYPPKVVVTPFTAGTSGAAGVAATGGFIGFVAVLVGYDLIRRPPAAATSWVLVAQASPQRSRRPAAM